MKMADEYFMSGVGVLPSHDLRLHVLLTMQLLYIKQHVLTCKIRGLAFLF